MNVDASTVIDATAKGITLLQAITEALKKKTPDVSTALSLVNQLQQHIDDLRTRNLQLERDVLNLDKQNFQLQKQVETDEAWREQLGKLEKVQNSAGVWIFREKGTEAPFYCPGCLNSRKLNFLKNGFHADKLKGHKSTGDYCPICGTSF